MADNILVDQKKDGLTVNLKFVSSKEMKKLKSLNIFQKEETQVGLLILKP